MDSIRRPLTRRETVRLGGAAAAGSVVARFAGPRATEARVSEPLPWDVRSLVPNGELDPPHIQCVYDDINRLAFLVGDIRFAKVLGHQLIEVVPPIIPKVDEGALYGLFADPILTKQKLTTLVEVGGELSVAALFTRYRKQVSPDVRKAVLDLWRDGIRLPFPATTKAEARRRKRAMNRLLKYDRRMTYKSFYDQPITEISVNGRVALNNIKLLGFLGWGKNDRCCKDGKGAGPSTCISYTGKNCVRVKDAGGVYRCSGAGDRCPGQNN